MSEEEIDAAESLAFRRMRAASTILLGLVAACLVLAPHFLWLWFVVGLYFNLSVYILFWPCPRCGKFFCMRFSLLGGIAWPWVDSCMHCGSKLSTKLSITSRGT